MQVENHVRDKYTGVGFKERNRCGWYCTARQADIALDHIKRSFPVPSRLARSLASQSSALEYGKVGFHLPTRHRHGMAAQFLQERKVQYGMCRLTGIERRF